MVTNRFPRYADTAFWRRPYKEAYFHGMGSNGTTSATPPGPQVLIPGAMGSAKLGTVWSAASAKIIKQSLKSYAAVGPDPTGPVSLMQTATLGSQPMTAEAWMNKALERDLVVLAQPTLLQAGMGGQLIAVDKTQTATVKQMSQAMPVLAEPTWFNKPYAKFVVAGGVALVFAGILWPRKGRFAANARYLTKAQVVRQWREVELPGVIELYGPGDKPAIRESWNNFTDMLCKEGRISMRQYETWTHPR